MSWQLAAYEWLLRSAVLGFVLLGTAWLALFLVREPARRISLITWSLVAALVAPWLPAVPGMPRWDFWQNDSVAAPTLPTVAAIELPRNSAPIEKPLDATDPVKDYEASSPADEPVETVASAAAPPTVTTKAARMTLADWVVTAYLAGVGAMLAWSAVGAIGLVRMVRTARTAGPQVRAVLRHIAGREPSSVRLLVHERARQPFTFSLPRPVIMLPAALVADAASTELRLCLAHEWAHVARRDALGCLVAGFCKCVYFYQPLAWWLARQLRLAQDHLADAQAAREATAADYAEFLTQYAARLGGRRLSVGLGISSGKSELYRRVVMLVNRTRPLENRSPRWWSAVLCGCAVVLGLALAGVGRPLSAQAPRPVDPAPTITPDDPQAPAKPDGGGFAPAPAGAAPIDKAEPLQLLRIEVAGTLPENPISGDYLVEPDGDVSLGPAYGRVKVAGATMAECEAAIAAQLKTILKAPAVQIVLSPESCEYAMNDRQWTWKPGSTYHLAVGDKLAVTFGGTKREVKVQPSGEIPLGPQYGKVKLVGLSFAEAEKVVLARLKEHLRDPSVALTLAWQYYRPDMGANLSSDLKNLRGEIVKLREEVGKLSAQNTRAERGARTVPAADPFGSPTRRQRVYAQVSVVPAKETNFADLGRVVQTYENYLSANNIVDRLLQRPEIVALPSVQKAKLDPRNLLRRSMNVRILDDAQTIELSVTGLPAEEGKTLAAAILDEFFKQTDAAAAAPAQMEKLNAELKQTSEALDEKMTRLNELKAATGATAAARRKIMEGEIDSLAEEIAELGREKRAKQRDIDSLDAAAGEDKRAKERRLKQLEVEKNAIGGSRKKSEALLAELIERLAKLEQGSEEQTQLEKEIQSLNVTLRQLHAQSNRAQELMRAGPAKVSRLKVPTVEEYTPQR